MQVIDATSIIELVLLFDGCLVTVPIDVTCVTTAPSVGPQHAKDRSSHPKNHKST